MTGPDIYGDIDDLVIRLRAEGAEEWADRLSGAVTGGSTGTEILMAVRWTLQQLEASGANLGEGARSLTHRLRSDIQTMLEG